MARHGTDTVEHGRSGDCAPAVARPYMLFFLVVLRASHTRCFSDGGLKARGSRECHNEGTPSRLSPPIPAWRCTSASGVRQKFPRWAQCYRLLPSAFELGGGLLCVIFDDVIGAKLEGASDRMRSRRINSSPSSRWAFQTSRPGSPALNCAQDGSSGTVLQRHIHCPAIRRLASGQHARVLRKLVASSQPGYAAISLSISKRTSIRFPTRFISKIYGTPAALCICCLRPSTPPYPAPPPNPHHVTEMVAIAVGDCQLNTSRRILAEIQLRINGFNTYG